MAQYEHLPIYKQTYDILLRTMTATKDFPREYKFTLGQKIKDELIELVVLIYRANSAKDKRQHIEQILERMQAVQPGDLSAVATSGDFNDLTDAPQPGLINAVINGGCRVSHRGDKSLSASWQYGPVDLLAVKAEGTVSAGTIKQFTGAYSLTETGTACMVENATLTGAGKILFRHRIESKDARPFANGPALAESNLDYIQQTGGGPARGPIS